ncbi:hypothetical protein FRACYDRAFT_244393 [Fragilariopsis cylindrus CCMP1102]|uniref:Oxidation resistance protein 1 n=1 Tax=Fragilariopsis cylindrus CCMP1102 TaxID=635003 RepID=A0A1E7F2Q6_9STRA|nr:hypothetical protein FRACYDRAFT_244393 [Fragilariopsis cylindrus CCMP1102]|eukprot:OEU12133.1 hypothetical protein FRACYDRAFT_244393 [Fragilariopsis cylindrus CCMP1102]
MYYHQYKWIDFNSHLPDSKRGESFWLKYSLVRDGSSLVSLLQNIDGEVSGGFFSNSGTVQSDKYLGTGESFLWKMKQPRCVNIGNSNNNTNNGGLNDSFGTLSGQVDNEAEIEAFKSESYYCNDFHQMCTHDKIIAGGGSSSYPKDFGNGLGIISREDIGSGLMFEKGSLMEVSSSASLTYCSPPLSGIHKDGSKFELVNLEVWGFTPCRTEEEARILEYKNMFFKRHSTGPV